MNIKELIIRRTRQLLIMLTNKGALLARFKGCYFEFYEMLNKIKLMGIKPKVFIDVGANRGRFTRTVNYIFPDIKIIAFEPLKNCYQELIHLQESIPNLKCYNVALANDNGTSIIYHNNYDFSSSILKMTSVHKKAYPYTDKETKETINLAKMDDIIKLDDLEGQVFMKIDVQGYEKHVLEGAVKSLGKIDYILCELSFVNLYENQVLFDEIFQFLLQKDFRFLGPLSTNFNKETGLILQIDALFQKIK